MGRCGVLPVSARHYWVGTRAGLVDFRPNVPAVVEANSFGPKQVE
jgi:hypothetical protein